MRRMFLMIVLAGACTQLPIATKPTAVVEPNNVSGLPVPTQISSEWTTIIPGIEERLLIPDGAAIAQMVTLRLDPAQVTFRVHYQLGTPLTIAQWRALLPTAQVIVNANFFTPEHTITGMLVADGVTYGSSFTDRGGMFSLQGGIPVMQFLVNQPWDGRALEQAVQAFPYLVSGGAPAYTRTTDTRPSRRTIIGLDSDGLVILMATPGIGLGLYDLSQYLPTAGIDLVEAFNLDGGGSTMLAITPTGYALASIDPVPAVLAVYRR